MPLPAILGALGGKAAAKTAGALGAAKLAPELAGGMGAAGAPALAPDLAGGLGGSLGAATTGEGAAGGLGSMLGKAGGFLKDASAPGGMARMIGQKFGGNPLTDAIGAFGNSYSPITGNFDPVAFLDKDERKQLELQRKGIENILAGKDSPESALVGALMKALQNG